MGPDDRRSPARVRDTYDDIAAHFSKTRAYPWPEVEAFLEDVHAGERGLDVGAAATVVQGDAATLPLGSGEVDVALYVAAIHHLPDRETRRGSLDELARVLAPGGRGLVSAWSTAHDRFDAPAEATEGFDTTVDWTLPGGETVPRFYHIYAPAEFEGDLAASALTVEETTISSGNCYARVRA